MPKPEIISITSTTMINSKVVSVHGTKGARVPRQYTVHFDRHNNVTHGFQHVPDIGELGYMTVDGLAANLQKPAEAPHRVGMILQPC